MSFTDVFIKRPVFATVLSLIILCIGIISFTKLELRQFPKIDANVVNVTTTYKGSNAKLMESFITSPIENVLAGVDGIDYMKSSNTQGVSSINLHFKLGYPIDVAVTDIRNKLSEVQSQLPTDADDPIISKRDPNVQPIMYIAFVNEKLSAPAFSDYLSRAIQPELESVLGVARAQNYGETPYAMRIWLDPKKMAALSVSAEDVRRSLQSDNVRMPSGKIQGKEHEFNTLLVTDLNKETDFDKLVVKVDNGKFIRLQDIGRAELASYKPHINARFNGRKAMVYGITIKSNANPLTVARGVRAKMDQLLKRLPQGMTGKIVWDNTKFISNSIKEVKHTIFEAIAVVMLVVFFFLGSLRALMVPAVTIPLSLVGVCFLMYICGFSVNTLTMLAMVLAIGMVVDDAIVVAENIHRHIEAGESMVEAAINGAREIRFAVIAMTLTLAPVYAPIGFLEGLTGHLFEEFAYTLAGAVIISGFVALTLTPMMCSKILSPSANASRLEQCIETNTQRLAGIYKSALRFILNRRWIVVAVMTVIIFGSYYLYRFLPEELAPKEDMGACLIIASGPATSNLAYTTKVTSQLGAIYDKVPEKLEYGIINGIPEGANSALSFLVLKDWKQRERSVDEINQQLFPELMGIPGMQMFAINPYSLPGAGGFESIKLVLKGINDYEDIYRVAEAIKMKASQNPAFFNVDTTLKIDQPQVELHVNRNLAADIGVSMASIGNMVNMALGEPKISKFEMNGRSYDVIAEVDEQYKNRPDALKQLYVPALSGEMVPLSSVAKLEQRTVPRSYDHFQQMRSATIKTNPGFGFTLGQSLAILKDIAAEFMTEGIQVDYSGESRSFVNASGEMLVTFGFALIFIFLVLSAQFESFMAPVIIAPSVILATAGALFTLFLTGGTLNIYTKIGLVTLLGLITKHGILMVEFADQLFAEGYKRFDAILEAATIRLRPILMTTAAMVLGAVPLVRADGAGAISRSQIGWVIVGGMTLGTLFTLFVVPSAYVFFGRFRNQVTTEAE